MTQYLVRKDQPFRGVASILLADGTVAYTDGMTLNQYIEDKGYPLKLVSSDELRALIAGHEQSMVEDPEFTTEANFHDMLGCLPPCRWTVHQGVEMFHISERMQYDIVSWFCRHEGNYFTFQDQATATPDHIAGKVRQMTN